MAGQFGLMVARWTRSTKGSDALRLGSNTRYGSCMGGR